MRLHRPIVSQKISRYSSCDLGKMAEGSLDSFSLPDSLNSDVGEQAIPMSGSVDVDQGVGLVGAWHKPIEGSNKR